jgi:hypothetical protein
MTLSTRSLFCVLLFCACTIYARGGEERHAAFDQKIQLDLWGKNLVDAYNQITQRAGIDVRISPSYMRPEHFKSVKVYLAANSITARQAIEWLSRAIGCRYRIDGRTSVWLSGSYDWMKEEPDVLIPDQPVNSLMSSEEQASSFEMKLMELVKANSLFGERYFLRIEEERAGREEFTCKLVAVLPATLKKYLAESLELMTKRGAEIVAPPARVISPAETALLKSLGAKIVVRYRKRPLREVLADLSLQTGLNIAFDHTPFRERPLPEITLELGEVTAREALEKLAAEMGLGGCELDAPGCVWLTARPCNWGTTASREFQWEGMEVKAFACQELAAAMGGGKVLAHQIRRRIDRTHPELWHDVSTAAVYHEKSGNLIVVAPREIQEAVQGELFALREEFKQKLPTAGDAK